MPGLLDNLGSGWDQFQAQFAPGAYAARNQAREQQATYNMLMQRPGMTPEMAAGMAMNPQAFGMGGGAYMPQAPSLIQTQDPFGGTQFYGHTPVSVGGGQTLRELPIGGAPAAPNAKGEITPSTLTKSNSTNAIEPVIAKIRELKAAGVTDRAKIIEAAVPVGDQGIIKNLLTGQFKLSEIPARSAAQKNAVSAIANELGLDEGATAARERFAKDYADTKGGLGYRLERGDAMLGHLTDAVENYGHLNTRSEIPYVPNWLTGSLPTEWVNSRSNLDPKQQRYLGGYKNGVATYSIEKGGFLGGPSGGAESDRLETRSGLQVDKPRAQLIGALENEVLNLESKYKGMDADRDRAFQGDEPVGKRFGVYTPERQAKIENLKRMIQNLKGGGLEAGTGSNPQGGLPQEIRKDPKTGKLYTKDSSGNIVPYKP